MRERRRFNQRSASSGSLNPRIKYILVTEGTITEVEYFQSISDRKKELGISSLIDIIPCEKVGREKGISNPLRLAEITIDQIEYGIRYKDLVNIISQVVSDNYPDFPYSIETLEKQIKEYFKVDLENIITDLSEVEYFISKYFNRLFHENPQTKFQISIETIKEYIETWIHVEEEDKIYIIADRDQQSFKKEQYDRFLELCRLNTFIPCISNPCFEFFLLLHSDNFSDIYAEIVNNEKKLLENRRIRKSKNAKRFSEAILCEQFPRYTKQMKNVTEFTSKSRIINAITNEKLFSEELSDLKTKIGSNVALLLSELIDTQSKNIDT